MSILESFALVKYNKNGSNQKEIYLEKLEAPFISEIHLSLS